MLTEGICSRIDAALDTQRDFIAETLVRLVKIPSVSAPPAGGEGPIQEVLADRLWGMGFEVSRVQPSLAEEASHHPAYQADHDLRGRPIVWGVRAGTGGGRSLLLAGHADTLPPAPHLPWPTGTPYPDALHGGRIYGPGSRSGKAGLAAAFAAAQILKTADLSLAGDLVLASVPDETWYGCQGMLAYVLAGERTDAALYLAGVEPGYSLSGQGLGSILVRMETEDAETGEAALAAALAIFEQLRNDRAPQVARLPDGPRPWFVQRLAYEPGPHHTVTDASIGFCIGSEESIDAVREALELRIVDALAGIDVDLQVGPGSRCLESWQAEEGAYGATVAFAAARAWQTEAALPSVPNGAFLLANHGGCQTAVGGRAPNIASRQMECAEAEEVEAYTRFLCYLATAWCGVDAP